MRLASSAASGESGTIPLTETVMALTLELATLIGASAFPDPPFEVVTDGLPGGAGGLDEVKRNGTFAALQAHWFAAQ